MFTVRTEVIEDGTKIRATGDNTSTTIRYAKTQSPERNHGKVCGAHLNKLLSREQQSKLRHPSGAQRVVETIPWDTNSTEPNPFWRNFYIDV
jgi:hypothetical protein